MSGVERRDDGVPARDGAMTISSRYLDRAVLERKVSCRCAKRARCWRACPEGEAPSAPGAPDEQALARPAAPPGPARPYWPASLRGRPAGPVWVHYLRKPSGGRSRLATRNPEASDSVKAWEPSRG